MSGGIEKTTEYIERLTQLHYDNAGNLSVLSAMRMLAIIKSIERLLTAYLSKVEL